VDYDALEACALVADLQSALDRAQVRIRELAAALAVSSRRLIEAIERADACEARALMAELEARAAREAAGASQAGADVSTYPPHP